MIGPELEVLPPLLLVGGEVWLRADQAHRSRGGRGQELASLHGMSPLREEMNGDFPDESPPTRRAGLPHPVDPRPHSNRADDSIQDPPGRSHRGNRVRSFTTGSCGLPGIQRLRYGWAHGSSRVIKGGEDAFLDQFFAKLDAKMVVDA